MDDCRSPSPPLHFPDIRSTPSPVRRRLPRPLPDPPSRLTFSAISTSSSSSLASSRASTDSSHPEKVLAIIHEIDAALHYTNSTRSSSRRQRPAARLPPAPDGTQQPAPPTAFLPASPHHPPRLRPASISSYSSVSSSSSSSSSAGDPSSPSTRAARTLRRRFSPRDESLREVRARDSDVCLQRVYERQLMTYLDGSIFAARPVLQRQGGGGGGGGRWSGLTP